MSERDEVPESVPRHAHACWLAGCHDFGDPSVVRQGAHLLHGSAEVMIAMCRRCGAMQAAGWYDDEIPKEQQ
jgi:hypothetical protein